MPQRPPSVSSGQARSRSAPMAFRSSTRAKTAADGMWLHSKRPHPGSRVMGALSRAPVGRRASGRTVPHVRLHHEVPAVRERLDAILQTPVRILERVGVRHPTAPRQDAPGETARRDQPTRSARRLASSSRRFRPLLRADWCRPRRAPRRPKLRRSSSARTVSRAGRLNWSDALDCVVPSPASLVRARFARAPCAVLSARGSRRVRACRSRRRALA